MCVNRESRICVLVPDLRDIGFEIAGEEGRVESDADVGAENAEETGGAVGDKLTPPSVVGVVLRLELGGDSSKAVGTKARDVLRGARRRLQGQGDGKREEVNMSDVRIDLGRVEGELAEVPLNVDIGVVGIGDRGLDQARAGIQKECQGCTNGEPEASSRDPRNCHGSGRTDRAELDSAVRGQRGAILRRGSRIVRGLAVSLKKEQDIVVVNGVSSEKGVDSVRGGLILQGDLKS